MAQLTHWIPERWREALAGLRDDINEIAERWLPERWLPGQRNDRSTFNGHVPSHSRAEQEVVGENGFLPLSVASRTAIDLNETDDEIVVTADLPGLEPQDFNVEITKERLVIRGEKRQEARRQEHGYHYQERRYGAFARAIRLPCEIDVEQARANYKRGILRVTLPKTARAKARRVKIQITG